VKAKQTGFWVGLAVLLLSSFWLFSCSKKEIKTEGISTPTISSDQEEAEKAKKKGPDSGIGNDRPGNEGKGPA